MAILHITEKKPGKVNMQLPIIESGESDGRYREMI